MILGNLQKTIAPFVLIFLCCFTIASPAVAENESVVAYSGKIAGDEKSTRLILDFDREVEFQTFYMDQPDRIIIDLPQTIFNFGTEAGPKPRGLVSFVRFGPINKNLSRFVVSLTGPTKISASEIKPKSDETGFRLIVDLDSVSASEFANLVNSGRQAATEALGETEIEKRDKPSAQPENKAEFTIVLDPGHGGIDGGAVGKSGVLEKDIVLSFAKTLKRILQEKGPFAVHLSRENDEFVSLKRRLEFSRTHKADLFISIHADSLRQRSVRGSTIYTLSKKASDKLSEQLAKSENSVDLVAGLSLEKEEEEAVTDILAELTTRETKQFSRQFSLLLVDELRDRVTLIKNPRRSASFSVLKAPEVPGILLELGYLSNIEDEKLLSSPEWQDKVANLVSRAVMKFFEPRLEN